MFADKLYSLSDEDLLKQYCTTRNPKAFREIYQRYKDPLFRYCAQMNLDRCASLMESFWLSLMQSPPTLNGRTLKNWLYIQVNRLLKKPLSAARDETVTGTSRDASTPETSLRTAMEASDVLKAVQQLPDRQRNIFLLFNECGLSLATVADIEQIPMALCRQELADGRKSVAFNLHGSARKPWKSSVTLAKEAELAAANVDKGEVPATQPQKVGARFPWITGSAITRTPAGKSTTANSSVEVAQA